MKIELIKKLYKQMIIGIIQIPPAHKRPSHLKAICKLRIDSPQSVQFGLVCSAQLFSIESPTHR